MIIMLREPLAYLAARWHPDRPTDSADREGIDHIVLAFAYANNTAAYQPHVPISTIRSEYPNAKVMIAVGGWGDYIGFTQIAKTSDGIARFAEDVNVMLKNTGADGVGKYKLSRPFLNLDLQKCDC